MKIFLGKSFSCSLNYQDEYICNILANKYEITQHVNEADILVFPSTCSCTEDEINNVMTYIYQCLDCKKATAKVYLTGCLTRKFKNEKISKWMEDWFHEYIDVVIPHNTPNLLLQKISKDFADLPEKNFGCAIKEEENNRMSLYIGNGCRNNCAFCKVSYQHYPLKSITLEEAKDGIDQANEMEIPILELIATNVSQFGLDLYNEPKLPELVHYVETKDKIKELKIIGFSYHDAIKFGFQEPLENSKKISYISGSLETGSPRLLEMIRKRFTPEQIIEFVKCINRKYERRLDLNIIAGLPTETFEDIIKTLNVLKMLNPYSIHICEYVNSNMLDLNRFPQLSDDEITEHSRIYEKVLTRRKVKTYIAKKPR